VSHLTPGWATADADPVPTYLMQDEDVVQLFSNASLDPELADSITAVRVVRSKLLVRRSVRGAGQRSAAWQTSSVCCVHLLSRRRLYTNSGCHALQVRDRQTNIGKGVAFVEFKTKAAAAAALRLAEPKLHGRPLRITFLKQPKASAAAAAMVEKSPATKPGTRT
jgi:RNA recognition motif-containing protein